MSDPLQVTYRNMEPSEAVQARIEHHFQRLQRHAKILGAHVTVQAQRATQPRATTFTAHVVLDVPGRQVAACRDTDPQRSHATVYAAIRDAMDAALRQLDDAHARRTTRRRTASAP